jgi:hypothetical protein
MDTLSHGLWGGALFGQKNKVDYRWAFFWGMAPDLFSFGPFFLTHLPMIIHRWGSRQRMEPPDPSVIPSFVYSAYDVTHSLVVWSAVALIVWSLRKKFPWVFTAVALHILCDIPTHSTNFFPTPFLWPLHTPFVNGRPWGRPPFTLINYALIALTYFGIRLYKSKRIEPARP